MFSRIVPAKRKTSWATTPSRRRITPSVHLLDVDAVDDHPSSIFVKAPADGRAIIVSLAGSANEGDRLHPCADVEVDARGTECRSSPKVDVRRCRRRGYRHDRVGCVLDVPLSEQQFVLAPEFAATPFSMASSTWLIFSIETEGGDRAAECRRFSLRSVRL